MYRNVSLDILKLIMAIMIVGLHTNFLVDVNLLANRLVAEGLFRIAVPIFFMINGYFFCRAIDTGRTLDWVKRALILYLVWMLVYAAFWFQPERFAVRDIVRLLKFVIFGWHHLWYLPGIIGSGVMMYLLRNQPRAQLLLLVIGLFMAGLVLQYAGNYHLGLALSASVDKWLNVVWVYRNFAFFGFPFFCMGYLAGRTPALMVVKTAWLLVAVAIGMMLLVTEVLINYRFIGAEQGFDILASLFILCPAIFLLFLRQQWQGGSKNLALYSAAIYFVHPMFVVWFQERLQLQGLALTLLVILTSLAAATLMLRIHRKFKYML